MKQAAKKYKPTNTDSNEKIQRKLFQNEQSNVSYQKITHKCTKIQKHCIKSVLRKIIKYHNLYERIKPRIWKNN